MTSNNQNSDEWKTTEEKLHDNKKNNNAEVRDVHSNNAIECDIQLYKLLYTVLIREDFVEPQLGSLTGYIKVITLVDVFTNHNIYIYIHLMHQLENKRDTNATSRKWDFTEG